MILLGFRASYEGGFGDASVVQCGRWKIIPVRRYGAVPYELAMLLAQALGTGAQFLVIEPNVQGGGKAEFIDVPVGNLIG